jgi:predicted GNAT family acetyltransferase
MLAQRLGPEPESGFVLWEDGGGPVSVTGFGSPTPNGMRIGPVYTPPERRGRGYAGALVAEVSQAQLDAGRRFCFLYTDLANPTSNRLYVALGYERVCDSVELDFV